MCLPAHAEYLTNETTLPRGKSFEEEPLARYSSEESRAKDVIDVNDEELEVSGEGPAQTGLFITPIPE